MPPPSATGRRQRPPRVRIPYDAVLKDLFQTDHPALLDRLARGISILETLNVEFAAVDERRADLIFLMADGSVLQLEFQSTNDSSMVYRMGRYCAMIGQRRRCPIRQVVLYTGQPKMRMAASADHGLTKFAYELHDIREFDAAELLQSGRPGDCALAVLARGGEENLRKIVHRAAKMPAPERNKLLTQLAVLAGLRKLRRRLKIEVSAMRTAVYLDELPIIGPLYKKKYAKDVAEARAEGMAAVLVEMLNARFGALPRWAQARVDGATAAQIRRWAKKAAAAETLEGVLGKR